MRPTSQLGAAAQRLERNFDVAVARRLWRRGWRVRLVVHTGYGVAGPDGWARILARVLIAPPGSSGRVGRGWRRFVTVSLPDVAVSVRVEDTELSVRSAVGGYVDLRVPVDLSPGWHDVVLSSAHGPPVTGRLRIVSRTATHGIVSDIDDTVMITALPRPLLAFWNTFVRHESTRRVVPGMPELFEHLLLASADSGEEPMVAYVSTGAWNVAPSIGRFLHRHGYPPGPLLMTDWGPTEDALFRSGREHKHETLRQLLRDLPGIRWTLIGDDGQHDPALYDELATEAPDRVARVLIRQLSPAEQAKTHVLPAALPGEGQDRSVRVPTLRGADGYELLKALPEPEPT